MGWSEEAFSGLIVRKGQASLPLNINIIFYPVTIDPKYEKHLDSRVIKSACIPFGRYSLSSILRGTPSIRFLERNLALVSPRSSRQRDLQLPHASIAPSSLLRISLGSSDGTLTKYQ